jgi:toxin ParE1/3/4
VSDYRFSNRALADLDSITVYTLATWGERQATRYIGMLEGACRSVVEIPQAGRRCEHVRSGLWRVEAERHVLFFRRLGDDVLVCRILHYRMLPEYQPIDDDE